MHDARKAYNVKGLCLTKDSTRTSASRNGFIGSHTLLPLPGEVDLRYLTGVLGVEY